MLCFNAHNTNVTRLFSVVFNAQNTNVTKLVSIVFNAQNTNVTRLSIVVFNAQNTNVTRLVSVVFNAQNTAVSLIPRLLPMLTREEPGYEATPMSRDYPVLCFNAQNTNVTHYTVH